MHSQHQKLFLMNKWSQHYRIVYEKYCSLMQERGVAKSDLSMRSMSLYLGISPGKGEAWKKGQWPSAEDMATIAAKLGFSYRWLVTGEGDPEGDDAPTPKTDGPCTRADPDMAEKIAALEAELRTREKELLEAKNEIIELQRKLLKQRPS